MVSKILLLFFAISVSTVCAGRALGQSSDDFVTVSNINMPMKIYIVIVDSEMYHGDCKKYQQLLKNVVHGRSLEDAFVYCYKEFNGFAAKLTQKEAMELNGEKGVYGVQADKKYSIDVESYSHKLLPKVISVFPVHDGRALGPSPDNIVTVSNIDTVMKIYIVQVDSGTYHGDCKQYQQLLKKVVHGRSTEDAFVYCYKEINGFAAKLTHEEAMKLNGEKGIIGVHEDKKYSIDVKPSSHKLLPNDIK